MRQEELFVLDAHEAVQAIGLAGRIMAKAGGGEFQPLAIRSANPLVAVEGFAKQVAIRATEVLAEAVEAAQVAALLRRLPTRDEHPLLLVRLEIVAGKDGMGGINGLGGHEEPLLFARLPGIDQMAMTTGALVAEIARINPRTFGQQGDPVLVSDFPPIHSFTAAVPDAEDDAALGGAVDLHPEVAAMPAAGHIVRPERVLQGRDLAIEGCHVGPLRYRID